MNRKINVGDKSVSYRVSGNGSPLVLLHGYLESALIWEPLVSQLEAGYRIIAVDLPGHGESEVMAETHTMELMAGAVREVLLHEKTGPVVMAGHSLGGYVALAFAELYPDLLKGYVLFHSHPHADTPEAVSKRNREIAIVRSGRKNLMYPSNVSMMYAEKNLPLMGAALARSESIAAGCPDEGIIAVLKGMIARPSRVNIVEAGRTPLLWILGRHDRYFSPEKALGGVTLPENSRVVILEESGHLGFVEETALSASLIDSFAQNLDRNQQ